MEKTIKENKMGTMPIGKLLLSMSAPMVASMLFQALYNVVDSIFVARLNQDALNAVSLAFPIQMLLMAFAIGTGVGMNTLISKSLGEKNFERANKTANVGVFLYICLAFIFCIIGNLFATKYYSIQTNNNQIIAYGSSYIKICIGFAFGLCAQVCGERLLQSTGRTDLAMIPQLTGAIFNMLMDPILIFGLFGMPRMEVAGAAAATVMGQCLAAIIAFILQFKKNTEIKLQVKEFKLDPLITKLIYKIGLPSIVMQSIGSVMNFSINSILIGFTEAATAVFGAYYKIQSFIFLPIFGMNNAVVPIISYNYGANKYDRVKKVIKLAIIIAISIMLIGTILFETIPDLLLKVFTPSEEMLKVGKNAFRAIGIHFPLAGFCIISISACQALGKPMYSLITSVCRQLVVLLPTTYLLSLTGNLDLVWFAFPIAEIVSFVLCVVFISKTYKSVLK